MKRISVFAFGLLVLGLAVVPALAADQLRGMERAGAESNAPDSGLPTAHGAFVASANGFAQVPAVMTPGRATFRARIIDGGTAMEYELRYDLNAPLTRAMLHVGQTGVNGAPAVALCMEAPPGPGAGGGGVPVCPDGPIGVLTGLILAQDLMAPASSQGVYDLNTFFAAMVSRITYVDVWSEMFPNHGEVRGQIAPLRLTDGGPGGPLGDGPGSQDIEPNN